MDSQFSKAIEYFLNFIFLRNMISLVLETGSMFLAISNLIIFRITPIQIYVRNGTICMNMYV
jgi:hypothetical protein